MITAVFTPWHVNASFRCTGTLHQLNVKAKSSLLQYESMQCVYRKRLGKVRKFFQFESKSENTRNDCIVTRFNRT